MKMDKSIISVDDLKALIYRLSGFKMQISDDDPLLTTIYINLAVLDSALGSASELHKKTVEQINRLPAAADFELKRASGEAIKAMASEVGKLANQIAGDSASLEKANAISQASKWVMSGLILCSVLFFVAGFYTSKGIDSVRINTLEARSSLAESRANEEIRAAHIEAEAEIIDLRRGSGWSATSDGKMAKLFFESGAGMIAAKCVSPVWDIVNGSDGKYCVPKRRDLWGSDEQKYGWKIP